MKIDTNGIQDFLEKPQPNHLNCARAVSSSGVDASLRTTYACLIEKATQTSDTDTAALERARELLLSGELDNPEKIRAAAKNIIEFGI